MLILLFVKLIATVVAVAGVIFIIVAIIWIISQSRCPSCHRFFKRKRSSTTILVPPTLQSRGQREIHCFCSQCSHRWDYKEAILRLDKNPSRCPECYEVAKRSITILVRPTSESDGTQRIAYSCSRCSYYWSYEEIVKDDPAYWL